MFHFILALAYKEIEYDYKPVHLVKDGGHQVSISVVTIPAVMVQLSGSQLHI